MDINYLKTHIKTALKEDIGSGDCSSICCIDEQKTNKAKLIAKQNGIICGVDVVRMVFEEVDKYIDFVALKTDGEIIKTGDTIFKVSGKSRSILAAERTALNYIQRLSGIATQTAEYVELIKGTNAKLLDTRKTTPTLRLLEKYAVKTGGGSNHRVGLYDMIMLKDNHIDFAGGISNAINRAYEFVTNDYESQIKHINSAKTAQKIKIEVEVRNFNELNEVLNTGKIDRIMLDNFSVSDLKQAISLINGRYETEASGGITKETIRNFAEIGVDFISVGALTHHINSLDLSLIADK
ncbi:MAG: carboxylating nicotinate-nucleotide diphosphorylase [Bacteroidales bacterium]|jgi:nicotinate-nucleotide pyrophosphorylase (carboxylating)|nr:carboxylating nicotinate-nucleotide diphosphorylase [Bacteroidales bacterium]